MNKKIFYIIPAIFLGLSIQSESLYAACTIESGPPKELSEYIQTTRTTLQAINTKYPNICTQKPTATASYEKFITVLDKGKNQVPLMNNIIVDFSYNILTVARLESSPIVIRHGKLLYDLENSSILPTIESLATKCQLDGPAAGEVITLLRTNNDLQDFFKSTVVGNPPIADTAIKQAIASHYSQESTQSCKDELDMSVGIESLIKKSEGFGVNISDAKERWEKSIKLIQGGSTKGTQAYNELQTKLFRQELARQGVGKNAMEQMLTNLECAQADGDEKNNIEKQAISQEKCKRTYVFGIQGLEKTLDALRWQANTSDEYIKITENSEKKLTQEVDILSLYSQLQSSLKAENNTHATTTSMITNLINIHTSILGLNLTLEKRIPKMTENCMKGSPDIVGGC